MNWSYDRKNLADFIHCISSFRKCYAALGCNCATYFFDGRDE